MCASYARFRCKFPIRNFLNNYCCSILSVVLIYRKKTAIRLRCSRGQVSDGFVINSEPGRVQNTLKKIIMIIIYYYRKFITPHCTYRRRSFGQRPAWWHFGGYNKLVEVSRSSYIITRLRITILYIPRRLSYTIQFFFHFHFLSSRPRSRAFSQTRTVSRRRRALTL